MAGIVFIFLIVFVLLRNKAALDEAQKKRSGGGGNSPSQQAEYSAQSRQTPPMWKSISGADSKKREEQLQKEAELIERLRQRELDKRLNTSASSEHLSISQLRAGEARSGMSVLIEDRQHDWLARQLREEGRAKKRGEALLDLGAAHDASCDAGEIKRFHLLHHDSSIDDGEL